MRPCTGCGYDKTNTRTTRYIQRNLSAKADAGYDWWIIKVRGCFSALRNAASLFVVRDFLHNSQSTIGAARSLCYSSTSGHYVVGTSTSRVSFFDESNGSVWKSFKAPRVPVSATCGHSLHHVRNQPFSTLVQRQLVTTAVFTPSRENTTQRHNTEAETQ